MTGKSEAAEVQRIEEDTQNKQVAKLLKEKHVAVIPGSGLGENCKDAVRISFAASEDTIRKATARMKEFIQEKAYES